MKTSSWTSFLSVIAAVLCFFSAARAASVNPGTGYTNDFGRQPPVADWATVSIAGTPGETYDLDTDVNTNLNVSVAGIFFQVVSNVNNPASQFTNATWSSSGLYLQTQPNNNRWTALLASRCAWGKVRPERNRDTAIEVC